MQPRLMLLVLMSLVVSCGPPAAAVKPKPEDGCWVLQSTYLDKMPTWAADPSSCQRDLGVYCVVPVLREKPRAPPGLVYERARAKAETLAAQTLMTEVELQGVRTKVWLQEEDCAGRPNRVDCQTQEANNSTYKAVSRHQTTDIKLELLQRAQTWEDGQCNIHVQYVFGRPAVEEMLASIPEVAPEDAAPMSHHIVTGVLPRPKRPSRPKADSRGLKWITVPGGKDLRPGVAGMTVDVLPFQISQAEVTVEQYSSCVKDGRCTPPHWDDHKCQVLDNEGAYGKAPLPRRFRGRRQPIVCVTFDQAQAFAAWSEARLPTDAEWLIAARSARVWQPFPWGDAAPDCDRAVIDHGGGRDGCGRNSTWPVCSKSKRRGRSDQGACDLIGNVWEWVDAGETLDDGESLLVGPAMKAIRGASWDNTALHSAERYLEHSEDWCDNSIGIRLARDHE